MAERSGASPRHRPADQAAPDHLFRFMDAPPEGGFAVACVDPGVSGQWVYGKDKDDALKQWQDRFDAGELTETEPA